MEEKFITRYELVKYIMEIDGNISKDGVQKFLSRSNLIDKYKGNDTKKELIKDWVISPSQDTDNEQVVRKKLSEIYGNKDIKKSAKEYEIPNEMKYIIGDLWLMHSEIYGKQSKKVANGLINGTLKIFNIDKSMYDQIQKIKNNADIIVKRVLDMPTNTDDEETIKNMVYYTLGILDIDKIIKIHEMISIIINYDLTQDVNWTEHFINYTHDAIEQIFKNYIQFLADKYGKEGAIEYGDDGNVSIEKELLESICGMYKFNNSNQENMFYDYIDDYYNDKFNDI